MDNKNEEVKEEEQAEPKLPEKVDPVDMLSLENLALRKELAQARIIELGRELETLNKGIREKYQLGPNDAIDPQNLSIVRR